MYSVFKFLVFGSLDFINVSLNLTKFVFKYKLTLVTELFVFTLLADFKWSKLGFPNPVIISYDTFFQK